MISKKSRKKDIHERLAATISTTQLSQYLRLFASSVEKMLQEINDAKVIVFVATDRNPNAFYECGYSVALGREVVTITDYHKNLPFDIRDRNAIAYGRSVGSLTSKLIDRLQKLAQVR